MTENLIISAGVPRAPGKLTEAVARMYADGVRVAIAVGSSVDRIPVRQAARAEALAEPGGGGGRRA